MRHTIAALLVLLAVLPACDKKTDAASETSTAAAEAETDAAAGDEQAKELTVYCGRNEEMIKPLMEQFKEKTGIEVKAQYAKSAELAATIMEEGEESPADLFFSQDVSTLGFLEKEGKLQPLPQEVLDRVPETYRSNDGAWVGTSGRARVLSYNTEKVKEDELPANVNDLIDPRWNEQIGWAPENASFQSFVAAMIVQRGEKATKEWLEGFMMMKPKAYPSNTPMVTAIGRGEIQVGLTNHYYLYRLKAEHGEDFPAANHYFRSGMAGSLVNAAGVGVLKTAKNTESAKMFAEFLLSADAQKFFAKETHEFPLVPDVDASDKLPSITELNPPPVDLGALGDLETAVKLLREVGALE